MIVNLKYSYIPLIAPNMTTAKKMNNIISNKYAMMI